ncbi:general secretion pathway protein [Stenotrophomonas tumulicola]|nr:general secretion pathway protein [Stenotrophomonas tumulicola]
MEKGRWDRNHMLAAFAAACLLGVLAWWGWAMAAGPAGAGAPRVQLARAPGNSADPALAAPLVGLLSPGSVRTQVQVLGVLAGSQAPLALLSIDGGAPRAFAPGQRLGPSTVLGSVAVDTVEVEQGGQRHSLPVPMLPALPEDGIVPAVATGAR